MRKKMKEGEGMKARVSKGKSSVLCLQGFSPLFPGF